MRLNEPYMIAIRVRKCAALYVRAQVFCAAPLCIAGAHTKIQELEAVEYVGWMREEVDVPCIALRERREESESNQQRSSCPRVCFCSSDAADCQGSIDLDDAVATFAASHVQQQNQQTKTRSLTALRIEDAVFNAESSETKHTLEFYIFKSFISVELLLLTSSVKLFGMIKSQYYSKLYKSFKKY